MSTPPGYDYLQICCIHVSFQTDSEVRKCCKIKPKKPALPLEKMS